MNTVIEMKKNNQKAAPKTASVEDGSIPAPESESEGALKRAIDRIITLNKDSTNHAFELGETFA